MCRFRVGMGKWRLSGDRVVSQSSLQCNVNAVLPGENYGWPYREGSQPGQDPGIPPGPEPATTFPIAEYLHTSAGGPGRSVTGGFVSGVRVPEELPALRHFCRGEIVSEGSCLRGDRSADFRADCS